MLDYMRAFHQRFCQEPECRDLQEQAEVLRQELKEHLDRNSREKLLKLVDLGIELREETSLAAFIARFQLALGIASELTPYSWLRTWYELYAKPNVRTATANRYQLIIETYTIPRIGNVKLKKLTTRHPQKLYK